VAAAVVSPANFSRMVSVVSHNTYLRALNRWLIGGASSTRSSFSLLASFCHQLHGDHNSCSSLQVQRWHETNVGRSCDGCHPFVKTLHSPLGSHRMDPSLSNKKATFKQKMNEKQKQRSFVFDALPAELNSHLEETIGFEPMTTK